MPVVIDPPRVSENFFTRILTVPSSRSASCGARCSLSRSYRLDIMNSGSSCSAQ